MLETEHASAIPIDLDFSGVPFENATLQYRTNIEGMLSIILTDSNKEYLEKLGENVRKGITQVSVKAVYERPNAK